MRATGEFSFYWYVMLLRYFWSQWKGMKERFLENKVCYSLCLLDCVRVGNCNVS